MKASHVGIKKPPSSRRKGALGETRNHPQALPSGLRKGEKQTLLFSIYWLRSLFQAREKTWKPPACLRHDNPENESHLQAETG